MAQYQQQPNDLTNQPKDSTLALISMILGIASFVCLFGIGGIAAVICGHMGKNEIKNSNGMIKGGGMATAGLILGYVNIALVFVGGCIFFFVLRFLGTSISQIFGNIQNGLY